MQKFRDSLYFHKAVSLSFKGDTSTHEQRHPGNTSSPSGQRWSRNVFVSSKGPVLLLFLLFTPLLTFTQTDTLPQPDSTLTPQDTTVVKNDSINPDSTFSNLLKKFGVRDTTLKPTQIDTTNGVIVSTDTTLQDTTPKKKRRKLKKGTPEWEAWAKSLDPNVAYKRSLMLPGLGQAYNRSYWKIPIVYAGFGTITYFFIDNHINYKEFQAGYRCRLDSTCTDTFTNINNSTLVSARDFYRRNRDFMVIVAVLWYGLNVVDAYVEAHLKYFDVSDDLSMQIKPSLMMVQDNRRRLVPGAGITFKIR